mmetsp:Transcript_47641/g.149329  ORF Transcript_47641/g.149329 Transcript_47641/m.149329 type:complete len:275 (+) Transcript_47641:208-1032(+)
MREGDGLFWRARGRRRRRRRRGSRCTILSLYDPNDRNSKVPKRLQMTLARVAGLALDEARDYPLKQAGRICILFSPLLPSDRLPLLVKVFMLSQLFETSLNAGEEMPTKLTRVMLFTASKSTLKGSQKRLGVHECGFAARQLLEDLAHVARHCRRVLVCLSSQLLTDTSSSGREEVRAKVKGVKENLQECRHVAAVPNIGDPAQCATGCWYSSRSSSACAFAFFFSPVDKSRPLQDSSNILVSDGDAMAVEEGSELLFPAVDTRHALHHNQQLL